MLLKNGVVHSPTVEVGEEVYDCGCNEGDFQVMLIARRRMIIIIIVNKKSDECSRFNKNEEVTVPLNVMFHC